MHRPVRITATGNVAQADGGTLFTVTLTAGSDAATLVVKERGSGGDQIWPTIKAAAASTVTVSFRGGIGYSGQLHGTLSGTSPEAGFELGI